MHPVCCGEFVSRNPFKYNQRFCPECAVHLGLGVVAVTPRLLDNMHQESTYEMRV